MLAGLTAAGHADEALAPRNVPAKSIPVPLTPSPQLQTLIAAPLRPGWNGEIAAFFDHHLAK
jgi:epsilon-lactone hydrolase